MKPVLAAVFLVLGLASAPAGAAQPVCGDSVTVRQGDTISRIADRCGISESSLMAANPTVESSGDLRVGATLNTMPNSGRPGVGASLSNLGTSASNLVTGLADQVGSSTQELLDRNPDLKHRLQRLGNSVGLTNPEAKVTIAPQSGAPGSVVTVAATGLPADKPVRIGAGPPGAAFEVIRAVQSSANGTLSADVTVPSLFDAANVPGNSTDNAPNKSVVFVLVGPDDSIQARSGRFQLIP